MLQDSDRGKYVAVTGAILIIVGSFLPWVTSSGQAVASGLGGQGLFAVTFCILAIGVIFFRDWEQLEQTGVLSMGILTVIVIMNVLGSIGEIPEGESIALATSPGIGIYISLLGGLMLSVGGGFGYVFGSNGTDANQPKVTTSKQKMQKSSDANVTETLSQLNELKEQGAITDKEFEEKKEELLDQI